MKTDILPGQLTVFDYTGAAAPVEEAKGKKHLLFIEAERDGERYYVYYAPYDSKKEAQAAADNIGKGFLIKHDYI